MHPECRKPKDRKTEAPTQADYNELKKQTDLLAAYQSYRRSAIEARDEAARNVELESRRISEAEEKIRGLVVKLNLAPDTF